MREPSGGLSRVGVVIKLGAGGKGCSKKEESIWEQQRDEFVLALCLLCPTDTSSPHLSPPRGCFAIRPSSQGWPVHSSLFLDLAKLPPEEETSVSICWRDEGPALCWGFTSHSGHCPHWHTLKPHKRMTQKTSSHTQGTLPLQRPRQRSKGDPRTRSR